MFDAIISSIFSTLTNGHANRKTVHEDRRFKKMDETCNFFFSSVKMVEDEVHTQREEEEERILQSIDENKYAIDTENAFELLDWYYAHVGICKLINKKMDVIKDTLEKTAYLLNAKSHKQLNKTYMLLSDKIRHTPCLYYLRFDFENHIEDANYMCISDSDMDTAYGILKSVEKLVGEVGQALTDALRKLY